MRYLADTHILIWALTDPARLSPAVRTVLESPATQVYYSAVNWWEMAIKFSLGKLDLGGHTPEELLALVEAAGFQEAMVGAALFASSHRLPRRHGDPFDRALIWQAIRGGFILLSHDSASDLYREDGLTVIH